VVDGGWPGRTEGWQFWANIGFERSEYKLLAKLISVLSNRMKVFSEVSTSLKQRE
jgi:hypothetical protein